MNIMGQFVWTMALFAIMTSTSMTAYAQQTSEINEYPPLGKLVDLGGYKLHINSTGEGEPTVVLIIGGGGFSFDWSLVQPKVSRFTRVCSYDRAGFAWSDLGPIPRTMKQEAYELHLLLNKAGVNAPYVLVGHSIGGLIARVYAEQYPEDVVGMVLVDSTSEDTTLYNLSQEKWVHIRENAKGRAIPPVQTMKSSPPKPPTEEDKKQTESNTQVSVPPKMKPPFDKLPSDVQKIRLWMASHPKPSATTVSDDFWAEELQAMYVSRAKTPYPLGDMPLAVLLARGDGTPSTPNDVPTDEWKRLVEEKRQQKEDFVHLSRNSQVIYADKSGHQIQLDEPELVIDAIRQVVEAARNHTKLSDNSNR